MSNEITEMITALRDGTITIEEAANQFRKRSWPRTRGPEPQNYLELAAAAQRDPEPYVPGSFDDVTAAYDRGQLTRQQYRILAEAASESLRAESKRAADGEDG